MEEKSQFFNKLHEELASQHNIPPFIVKYLRILFISYNFQKEDTIALFRKKIERRGNAIKERGGTFVLR